MDRPEDPDGDAAEVMDHHSGLRPSAISSYQSI